MTSMPMTSLMEDAANGARERARAAMAVPLGFASPLWFAFGAAASIGVTWWWMTRWTKAVNLEAMTPHASAAPILTMAELAPGAEIAPEPTLAADLAVAAVEEIPAIEKLAIETVEPVAAPEPDDLTRLVGIGPKLADALAARGVTCFSHLAAWTADDLATIDAALSLKGRAVRDAWVAQARRFAAQVN